MRTHYPFYVKTDLQLKYDLNRKPFKIYLNDKSLINLPVILSLDCMTTNIDCPSTQPDERKTLYDHWRTIPSVTIIEAPKKFFSSHPARSAILRILRAGIIEEDPEEPSRRMKRHALSPKEIKGLLNESEKIKMSQTNLYFHLNTLEEVGAIKVVAKLLEKRHKIAYYGRVARLILTSDPEESLATYRRRFGEMGKLVRAMQPDIDPTRFDGLPEEYLEIKRRRDKMLADWIAGYDELMGAEGIDSILVFELLKDIASASPENIGFLRKVADLFGVDLEGST